MKLSPTHRLALHNALLDAFPTQSALRLMIWNRLGERPDVVAGGGDLGVAAGALIQWAESSDQIGALLDAACRANPTNRKLRAVRASVSPTDGGEQRAPLPSPRPAPSTPRPELDVPEVFRLCASGPNGERVGTAWLLREDRVATARHVLADAGPIDQIGATLSVGARQIALEFLLDHEDTDLAVLRPTAATGRAPLPLADRPPEPGDPWLSRILPAQTEPMSWTGPVVAGPANESLQLTPKGYEEFSAAGLLDLPASSRSRLSR